MTIQDKEKLKKYYKFSSTGEAKTILDLIEENEKLISDYNLLKLKMQNNANVGYDAWADENEKLKKALKKIKNQHLKIWTIANNALN